MSLPTSSLYNPVRRIFVIYLGILLGMAVTLGVLHWFFADLKVEGVLWLNLDKERNIPTWFSGMLFFLFGCAAMAAYYWEQQRNAEGQPCFHLPILWVGVGLAGLLMSLDEITILHENLYWREIRQVSGKLGDPWKYVTQWQILLAPAMILVLSYFVLFFSKRFSASPNAQRSAFAGIGCWVGALFLEGLRGTFKLASPQGYAFEVLIEEELEMIGTVLLLASIVLYVMDIALDFSDERRDCLKLASQFLTQQAILALTMTFLVLSALGGTIYLFAQKQALTGALLPRLYRKAVQPQPDAYKRTPPFTSLMSGASPPGVWFENIKEPVSIADSDGEALVRFIAASMAQQKNTNKVIPVALQRDKSPRIIFLSVSDGATPAHVVMGADKGLTKAIERALSQVDRLSENGYRSQWIKLDIVQDVHSINHVDLNMPLALERSLQGIAFDRPSGVAFLPEELVAYTLVNSEQKMRPDKIAEYLNKRSTYAGQWQRIPRTNRLPMHRFTTISFFFDGQEVVRLYRGHRLFHRILQGELLSAARWGGQYLIRAVGPKGKFVYLYQPKTAHAPEKYNILRHAGTVYAMLELYEMTGETELLQAARRAIVYLLQSAKPCPIEEEEAACIVENGYVKLGGNALAVMALAKYIEITHDRQYMPILLRLGRWVQSVQGESGAFLVHKQAYPGGEVVDFVSQYYPGEALLAMVRLYALEPRRSWLDTAEKGAQYLINVRDRSLSVSELSHDHWLLYALNELYRHRPNPLYLNHALRIARAIVQSQNRNPTYPDWRGSYYHPPRSTPTATRMEGLCAAYQLAHDFGDPQEAETILESIRLGVAFQLQTQFWPEAVMYLKDPQRSLGGVRRSLTNFEIRIDYVQHHISSLLGLYRIQALKKS